MKGVLRTKIFKMIGIVFAIVFGVAGSVLGAMAIMGKFKTPVVYPTTLEFAVDEQIVIEGKTYNPEEDWETQFADKDLAPKIESFVLNGTNPKSEHEVNKTKCFVWFEDAESSSLITLCDKNGKPLTPNSNLRYEVHCNEPIYYMINEVGANETTDGKVLLYARSVNETLKRPEKPMTIWIDRKVESVFVNYEQSDTDEETHTQSIHLGIDMGFDFKYLVDTPLSLKPISKESAKEIEIYYVSNNKDADYGTDYYRVTPEACDDDNSSSPVANILEYANGTYRFQSSKAGKHQFILAVFPTYKSKTDYYTSIEGLEFENPNFNKTQNMLTTELNIEVEDIEISKVGLSGSNIVLDLYSTSNYIYLDNENEDNNLGLYMKKGVAPNQVNDYTRFDEVNMEGFDGDVWRPTKTFVASLKTISNYFSVDGGYWIPEVDDVVEVNTTNKFLSNNLVVVDSIRVYNPTYNTDTRYYCNNGVAVLDTKGTIEEEDNEIKLLKPGSYLNFYIYSSTADTFTVTDFDYTATASGAGRDKKWQITAKELPQLSDDKSLYVGILVVNFSGEFHISNFYDAIPVSLDTLELSYKYNNYDENNVKFTANNATANFSITFDETNTYYPTLGYENIITDLAGTYTNFVYVVEEGVTMVDTLPIKYVVGEGEGAKTYLVVGYLDDEGKFVNAIRVNENVSKENQTCSIQMLQLKHLFGEKVEDYINTHITSESYINGEEVLISADKVVKLEEKAITVKAEYVLNTALLTYTYGNTNNAPELTDEVYENTSGYTLTLVSSNIGMLGKIVNFYGIDKTFIKVTSQYSGRITIGDLVLDAANGMLGIPYEVGNALEKPQELKIDVWLEINDIEFDLGTITILNGSPDEIVLKSEAGAITLASSKADVANDKYIIAKLGYKNDTFEYSFKIKNGINEKELSAENIFNQTISNGAENGFQDGDNINKGQALLVNYSVSDSDKAIFNTDAITFDGKVKLAGNLIGRGCKENEFVVLAVTIGETTGFIKVVTDTSLFKIETKTPNQNVYSQDGPTANLSDFVKFTYTDTETNPQNTNVYELPLSKTVMVNIINIEVLSYGDGNLMSFQDVKGNWTLKKNAAADVVLTVADNGVWSFTKEYYYVPLSISFEVETIAGNIEIQVNFTSSVNIGVSQYWSDRIIYAGTKISLQGTEYSMFQVVKASGVTEEVSFKVKNGENLTEEFTFGDNFIGEVIIVPVIDGKSIETEFVFTVRPNVLATVKQSNLTSETTYTLNGAVDGIYKLQTYQTDITFGGEDGKLYTKKVYYNDAAHTQPTNDVTDYFDVVPNNVIDLIDTTQLEFVTTNEENPKLDGGATLSIGKFEELNVEKTRLIRLVYKGIIIREDEFTITNKHVVSTEDTDGKNDGVLNFKALKEYDVFASVTGFKLQSIDADNLEFDIVDNKFTIKTIVDESPKEDVELLLTFKKVDSEQLLKYNCTINILPYTPETKGTISGAYSGSNYDLFGGIYEASEIEADVKIQKLYVTGVKYSDSILAENVASTLISNWGEGGSGYLTGVSGPACVVRFNEISGDNLNVYVEFSLTYTNGKTYIYYIPLSISNRQTLSELKYPESDLELVSGTFKFIDKYEKDALKISGLSEKPVDEVYSLSNLNYEAVLIYTDTSTEINFKYDDVKKLSRFVVTNVEGLTTTNSTSTDITIELIGYQNNGGIANYISKINTGINKVVLPSAQQGMFGTLIFKVSTVSGNYAYYNVYVYCKGTTSSVNYNNNLEVIYYENGVSYLNAPTKTIEVIKTNTDATTYVGLVDAIDESVYFSTFKTEYHANTTNVYLYNGVYTGEEETGAIPFNYNDKQWQPLTTETINVDKHFNVVTLGLVMDDGVQEYCYGTITIYVQPENSVAVNGLVYQLPNGYFTADIDASQDKISSPFGTDWTAEIVEITDSNLATASGSEITLNKKVAEDIEIYVKYTNSNGTIVYVTYTYKATIIPEQNSSTVVVGSFVDETTGFDVDINIQSTTEKQGNVANKTFFFGTYNGEYTVSVGENTFTTTKPSIDVDEETGTKITFDFDNELLTFPQSNVEQTFKITITYTNFSSTNNTRTFTFKVLPGYEFASKGSEGLSTSNRAKTDEADYTSTTGSSLNFTKTTLIEEIENKLYKFTVADLDIYTNANSKLILTFDENSYVLGLSANKLELASTGKANFVHSAVDKDVTMTISVQDTNGNEFAKRNLYLTVAKTYTTLQANYVVDRADHENVVSGYELENVHNKLMVSENGRCRLVLINNSGTPVPTANLLVMGFATYGNPNFIKFTSNSFATIKTAYENDGTTFKQYDIQFNTVTANTLCEVLLNNNAGIETNSVKYVYQIMAGLEEGKVDGLDYSSITGYDGTAETIPYVSFELDDRDNTKQYSKKFIVGTMEDARNETVFLVNEEFTKQETLVGYQNAIQYSTTHGNYNLYLTLNLENKNIELLVERTAGLNVQNYDANITELISIGGVNGEKTIIENLTIVLSNHNIEEKYKETIDGLIYGGFKIDLFKDGKFVEDGSDSPKLTYELANSLYVIKGQEHQILASQTNNDLFEYNKDTRIIQTKAVASDVRAEINFLVKDGNYVIKTIRYNLNVYLNMKFVVNGDDTSALETDFVLTNKDSDGTKQFPITVNFISGSSVNKENDVYQTNKNTYYKVLSVDLYRLKSQQNNFIIDRDEIKITLNSDIPGDVLKVTNDGIKFNKDFSGEIELKLSAVTQNGEYVQYWTIYVTPIVEIDLAKTETSILQTSAASPFNSGASVDLISNINDKADEDVGVVVDTDNNFSDYIDNGGVTVNYAYKIYTFAENSGISGLTSEQLFNMEDSSQYYQYYVAEGNNFEKEDKLNGHTFTITLPNVPSTLDVQSYLVVYEIYVEYLDLTRIEGEVEVFYVTYNVINKQKVNHYQYQTDTSSDVWYASDNVNISTRVDNAIDSTKYYLDLFYYQEELTIDATIDTIYTLIYTDGNYKLTVKDVDNSKSPATETTNAYEATVSGDELIFGTGEYKYNPTNRQLDKRDVTDTSKYNLLGTMSQNPNNKETYYSVFKSDFRNIVEFKNFIDLYLDKTSVRIGEQEFIAIDDIKEGETVVTGYYEYNDEKYVLITETDKKAETGKTYYRDVKTFTLVEIQNGRYGIDLNENKTTLINNELNEKLCLVVNDVETITLPDFKLYINSSITPVGNTYTIAEMGLSNYFTAGTDWDDKIKIIGIGTPTNNWVNDATRIKSTDTTKDYGTINIPNGNVDNIETENADESVNTYKIYKVIFEGEGGGAYYSVTQSYYYIEGETGSVTSLAAPNYTGIESYLYSVAYNPNESGDVVLNLSKAVKVWEMQEIKKDEFALVNNSEVKYKDFVIKSVNGSLTVEDVNGKLNKVLQTVCGEEHEHTEECKSIVQLTLKADILNEYKLNNPTAKTYPRITATIKANGIELQLVIEFALPTE